MKRGLSITLLICFIVSLMGCNEDPLQDKVFHITYRNESTHLIKLIVDHFGEEYAMTLNPNDSFTLDFSDHQYIRESTSVPTMPRYVIFNWVKIQMDQKYVRKWDTDRVKSKSEDMYGYDYRIFTDSSYPDLDNLCPGSSRKTKGKDCYMTISISEAYYYDTILHGILSPERNHSDADYRNLIKQLYSQNEEDGTYYLDEYLEERVLKWAEESNPEYLEQLVLLNEVFDEDYAAATIFDESE